MCDGNRYNNNYYIARSTHKRRVYDVSRSLITSAAGLSKLVMPLDVVHFDVVPLGVVHFEFDAHENSLNAAIYRVQIRP